MKKLYEMKETILCIALFLIVILTKELSVKIIAAVAAGITLIPNIHKLIKGGIK